MPYKKLLIPLGIVLLSVLTAGILKATKQEASISVDPQRIWSIDVVEVKIEDVRPSLRLYGEVIAGREIGLRSLSAGVVEFVAAAFIEGGRVTEGEKLLSVDPFVPTRRLSEQEALLAEAQARHHELFAAKESTALLLEEERRQLEIIKRDLQRYQQLPAGVVSEQTMDEKHLAVSKAKGSVLARHQQLLSIGAQINQQQAIIDRHRAAMERAEENLKDTQVFAPFDGYLTDIKVATGTRLNIGDPLAKLIDLGRLEVKVFLSNAQFGRVFSDSLLALPLEVAWNVGATKFVFHGVADRMESQIDSALGGVHVFARLKGSASESLLRPGAVVDIVAQDSLYEEVARLPEGVLHDDRIVYVVAGDRLKKRNVSLVGRDGNYVLVQGELVEGDLLAVTRFDGIMDGLLVKMRP
ncbi:MAG: efflux RND transporter periplasmic adaptor subunit [Pseudomonadota bacterium]|nr:efflux RND transporter periplasmic adaptor subunit [Pseudomonadota bacterium]